MPAVASSLGDAVAARRPRDPVTARDPRVELVEARDSLAYWEDRAARLPRRAVRRRREAREMAMRWRGRVAEAEKAAYGRGLLGLLVLALVERRLPESTRRAQRRVVRRGFHLLTLFVVAAVALVALGMVALVEVLLAILRAAG